MKSLKNKVILLVLICLIGGLLPSCSQSGASQEDSSAENGEPTSDSSELPASDFPDINSFTVVDDEGNEYTEDIFKNADVTAINVWGITCPPCIREMPALAEYRKTLPDNVQLYLLCVDGEQDPDTMRAILDEAGYDGVNWVSGSGDIAGFVSEVRYIPTTVFVDSEGNMLGGPIIGAVEPLPEVYDEYFNERLRSLGKKEIE